jgi:hypothetical protein
MEQDEFQKGGFNSSAPEGLAVPAPYVKPFIILLSETNSIWNGNCVAHQYA